MIMTGLAYAAEGLNSLNEISIYEQNFIAAMSKSYLMLIPSNARQSFPDIKIIGAKML